MHFTTALYLEKHQNTRVPMVAQPWLYIKVIFLNCFTLLHCLIVPFIVTALLLSCFLYTIVCKVRASNHLETIKIMFFSTFSSHAYWGQKLPSRLVMCRKTCQV